jgi:hypothetical protein
MIGRAPVVQDVFTLLRRLAPHARTALVTGETEQVKRSPSVRFINSDHAAASGSSP